MIVYRGSDIKFSWEKSEEKGLPGRICGYVKEGANAGKEKEGEEEVKEADKTVDEEEDETSVSQSFVFNKRKFQMKKGSVIHFL